MLLCRWRVILAPTDIRCVKAPKIRVGAQDNSFFAHHWSIWTHPVGGGGLGWYIHRWCMA
eukprot:scaffold22480_cov173-Skeletonema_marinoi.AAC.1